MQPLIDKIFSVRLVNSGRVENYIFKGKKQKGTLNIMCGIVGFTGNTPAAQILIEGLEQLEYRGYDSAGIAVLYKHSFTVKKTVERIGELKKATDGGRAVKGELGIGHTRWATHGGPSKENAHPHLSFDRKFAVVHNGIIENYALLREELKEDGIRFLSETDTEVVPNLIAKYYSGDILSAVTKAIKRLKGSFALGIICTDYPDTLIAVKHFSPLIVGIGKENKYIASDITALVPHTKKVAYLEDRELAVLTPNCARFYNSEGNEIIKKTERVNIDAAAAEKGGYDHFMMKEMMEQPKAVRETIIHRIKNSKVHFDGLNLTAERLKSFNKICIIACGSAYHAGMVGKYILEKLTRLPVEIDVASEFRYRDPIIDNKTLTIVISQSGETADTLAGLNEAKEKGSYVLAVVNVVASTIANAADDVLYTHAGPEIAVATTKGYTTQVALLYLFAIYMADILGSADNSELAEMLKDILRLPELIELCLNERDRIKDMAKRSCYINSIFFIGRNIDYAVALEASLKLKEISYIHSEAYAAGELKHGTISLIEHGTTVMALSCYTPLTDKLISNIKEVKARGAFVVACANEGNTEIVREADEVIYIPKVHKLLYALLEVVPFQLYAYYVAVCKDCDVDKPRNLAKSVTVE